VAVENSLKSPSIGGVEDKFNATEQVVSRNRAGDLFSFFQTYVRRIDA
jgi:hypothetical protein